ncbi:MAG: sigma-70 family RNA polymerase sigma factor [Anaerolineae bacterium]|nr:sigma-70 family RNA polymerase sigma factor [Anaerolineae bacterium]NIQ82905.1 sigma-70 family RNA polymerase sigma factor [Anaerolineae bacterium]
MSYSTTIHSQDANLYVQAQGGDAQSLEKLMCMHEGLVHHIVRQQWRGPLSYEQTIHAGRIGLWRAVLGFDPGRGYAFSTYAGVVIARHVWHAVRYAEKEEGTVLVPAPSPSYVDPWTEVLAEEVQTALYAMVARLPASQRWIVCTYYGLDGRGGCTLAELGRRRGCSRQAIHYHLRKALIALRHPAFSALLRALLDRNSRAAYLRALRAQGMQP